LENLCPNLKPTTKKPVCDAGWLETSIGRCFCGTEPWHAEIHSTTYDGSASIFEVGYPACHRCFGIKSGQRASRTDTERHKHEWARDELCRLIYAVTGVRAELEPGIEAYMFYNSATRRIYPHLCSDYYWGVTTYWPEDQTIRLQATGEKLIWFPDPNRREWDLKSFTDNPAALPHNVEIDESYKEYLKDHNHRRQTMEDARGWLAWLLGEWLMERQPQFYRDFPQGPPPPLQGQRLTAIVQPGIWKPNKETTDAAS
jgi:hypothetical protein